MHGHAAYRCGDGAAPHRTCGDNHCACGGGFSGSHDFEYGTAVGCRCDSSFAGVPYGGVEWSLGAFEVRTFDVATVAVARSVADLTASGALLTVAGGGDTIAALRHAGVQETFSCVSSAGGAFLEWLKANPCPVSRP